MAHAGRHPGGIRSQLADGDGVTGKVDFPALFAGFPVAVQADPPVAQGDGVTGHVEFLAALIGLAVTAPALPAVTDRQCMPGNRYFFASAVDLPVAGLAAPLGREICSSADGGRLHQQGADGQQGRDA